MPTSSQNSRGPYKSGIEKQKIIIEKAIQCMVNYGYHNFSLRKVAKYAGISIGNLQHHFPNKKELLNAMLDTVLAEYDFSSYLNTPESAEQQLKNVLSNVIQDLNSKFTTHFFPELWSLANHDETAHEAMDKMYSNYRSVLKDCIQRINPKLNKQQVETLSIFISSSIEGHTMFIGHQKQWQPLTPAISNLALDSFIYLIKQANIPS